MINSSRNTAPLPGTCTVSIHTQGVDISCARITSSSPLALALIQAAVSPSPRSTERKPTGFSPMLGPQGVSSSAPASPISQSEAPSASATPRGEDTAWKVDSAAQGLKNPSAANSALNNPSLTGTMGNLDLNRQQ